MNVNVRLKLACPALVKDYHDILQFFLDKAHKHARNEGLLFQTTPRSQWTCTPLAWQMRGTYIPCHSIAKYYAKFCPAVNPKGFPNQNNPPSKSEPKCIQMHFPGRRYKFQQASNAGKCSCQSKAQGSKFHGCKSQRSGVGSCKKPLSYAFEHTSDWLRCEHGVNTSSH